MRPLFFLFACQAHADIGVIGERSAGREFSRGNTGGTPEARTDFDISDNTELKNLRELAICSSGLQARQATFQDANTHSLYLANSLVPSVKALLDLGVPLHATFLMNVQLAAATVFRVGWHSAVILSSPYFHAFQTSALSLTRYVLEEQLTATNRLVDAPRQRQGQRSLSVLAVRAAQKTDELMRLWRQHALARVQQVPPSKVELPDDGAPRECTRCGPSLRASAAA